MAKKKLTKNLDELTREAEKLNSQLTEIYIKLQPLELERDRLWTKFKTAQEARDTMLYADLVANSTNGLPLTQAEIDLLLIGDHKSTAAYRAASTIENNKLFNTLTFVSASNSWSSYLNFYKSIFKISTV